MRHVVALGLVAVMLASCRTNAPTPAGAPRYQLSTVTAGLVDPAGVAVGPEGIYLSSSKQVEVMGPEGALRTVASGSLVAPQGLAIATGSLFIADPGAHRIFRQLENAPLEPFAGTGTTMFPIGDGGLAISAQLDRPTDVAIDGAGNLYFTDAGHHRVRRVDPDGRITTVAGDGQARYAGDGSAATEASLNAPAALALGADGSLYVADTANHVVRRIDPRGRISTVAGNGHEGFAGDQGPAAASQLASPSGLVVLSDGNLLVADTGNHRVRWLQPGGAIATVAGNGSIATAEQADRAEQTGLAAPAALALAPDHTVFVLDRTEGRLIQLRTSSASP